MAEGGQGGGGEPRRSVSRIRHRDGGSFSLRSGGALYISELYTWVMVVVVVLGGVVNLAFF